jgi:hypothetical protein
MPDAPRASLPETLAIASLGVLTLTGGWFIVWRGGFASALGKRSREFVEVAGLPAAAMAALQLTVAALALTWLLRQRLRPLAAGALAFGAVFGPPLLFQWLR